MGVQNSINSILGTAAAGAVGIKHLGELKAQEVKEIGKAQNIMSEAWLKSEGFNEEDIKSYLAASAAGMKPSPEYLPRHDEMKRAVSEGVLKSETFAKIKQNRAFRQRFLDLTSTQEGKDKLAQAVSPMNTKPANVGNTEEGPKEERNRLALKFSQSTD